MSTSTTPTLWFQAPDLPGAGNAASSSFMDLFSNPSAWQVVANQSVGLVLDETYVLTATTAQLSEVINFLNAHHLQLMMVSAVVPVQANGVGQGQEGFDSGSAFAQAVQRIASLGGTLNVVGMDAPLYVGTQESSGPQLSITALAQQVAQTVKAAQSLFPNVQFMDGEGMTTASDLVAWQQAFKAATGTPISSFVADADWSASGIVSQLEAYAAAAKASGAAFGISGNSTAAVATDQAWTLAAETNIAASLANPLLAPTNIVVQTWDPNPTVVLPEGLASTLSHVALETAEISPLYSSHYLTGGAGLTVSTVAPVSSYVGSAADAIVGQAVLVPGIDLTVTSGSATGATFAVVVTDVAGTLSATAKGAGMVSGQGSEALLLTGGLADINAELATLTYTGAAAGTDTIDVTTYDGQGLVDDHQMAVAIAAPIAVTLTAGLTASALYQNIYGVAPSAAGLAPVTAAMAAGKTLAQAAALWLAQAQATISALCEQVQGVSASASTLVSLTQKLAGGTSLASIRASLASAASVQSELSAFYQSRYGTAPTAAQLAALTAQLAGGTSLQTIEAPLLAGSAAENQITALYQAVLGQAPGATDLATQARALLTGTSLTTIRGALAAGSLAQANLSALYNHVYDTPPTAAQLATLTTQLAGSTSYAQIQAQFTTIAQGMVTAAYQSVLNLAPTASQLSNCTGQIMAGTLTESGLFSELGNSAQSIANVTSLYQQAFGQAPTQAALTAMEDCLYVGSSPVSLSQLKIDMAALATLYPQITGQPVSATALTPLIYDFVIQATLPQIRTWTADSAQVSQTIQTTYQSLFGNPITGSELNTLQAALAAGTTTMTGVQASLKGQAAADLPVVTGVVAAQTATENTTVTPFAAINISDSDPGVSDTVTVSLSGAGHMTNGYPFLNAAGTQFVYSGQLCYVQANLRILTVVPPAAGGSTTLSVAVKNSAGNTTTDTVTITTAALKSPGATSFAFMPASSTGETVAASSGETFVFPNHGFGHDTITGFNLTSDVFQLPKAMVSTFAGLQSLETNVSGGTMIAFGPSDSIFVAGVAPSSLHASNFTFV